VVPADLDNPNSPEEDILLGLMGDKVQDFALVQQVLQKQSRNLKT